MYSDPLATLVTTTSYGTWLPGDERGYVDNGQIYPSRRYLKAHVEQTLGGPKVTFSSLEQQRLFQFLKDATEEFGYTLTDAVV